MVLGFCSFFAVAGFLTRSAVYRGLCRSREREQFHRARITREHSDAKMSNECTFLTILSLD